MQATISVGKPIQKPITDRLLGKGIADATPSKRADVAKGGIVVKPVMVVVIGEVRIESYLFWGPKVMESRKELEILHVVVELKPGHRGERAVEGVALGEKCGGGTLDGRLLKPSSYSGAFSGRV